MDNCLVIPGRHRMPVCAALAFVSSIATAAAPVFEEDFETGTLDPRVTISTIGSFASASGIKSGAVFGSTNAFGFGRTTCPASCFDANVTGFTIDLGAPTFVGKLSFKDIELYGNWGAGGALFVDGALFGTTHYDYGRLPYNDLVADTAFRTTSFDLNRVATTIELRVRDITSSSEILVDDIRLEGATAPVPEPASAWLLLAGLTAAAWGQRRHKAIRMT